MVIRVGIQPITFRFRVAGIPRDASYRPVQIPGCQWLSTRRQRCTSTGVHRDGVSLRIAKDEGGAERAVEGRRHDLDALLNQVVVHSDSIITREPQCDTEPPRPAAKSAPGSAPLTANEIGDVSNTTAPGGECGARTNPTVFS